MFRRGIDLKRVVVVPDDEEAIGSTVQELSQLVGPTGYVLTTGGIGPTHDDITYESVVRLFSLMDVWCGSEVTVGCLLFLIGKGVWSRC